MVRKKSRKTTMFGGFYILKGKNVSEKINVPHELLTLVTIRQKKQAERERAERQKKRREEITRKKALAEKIRLALPYAQKIFSWTNTFGKTSIGRKILNVPAKQYFPFIEGVELFRENVPGCPWRLIGLSSLGVFWQQNGCGCRPTIAKTPEELAGIIGPTILKAAWTHINSDKVWETIRESLDE